MADEKHLYMVIHPNHSLIASALEPSTSRSTTCKARRAISRGA
jgi:hypothetical protein